MGVGRYLVEAIVLEGRSISELARSHRVSRFWIYKLLATSAPGGNRTPCLAVRSSAQLDIVLAGLKTTVLKERIVPSVDLRGSGPRREISRREALVESIRHAALHLGELRLTRDLVIQGEAASP